MHPGGAPELDANFSLWRQQQELEAHMEQEVNNLAHPAVPLRDDTRKRTLMEREIKRLAHPDIPLKLVFQGTAKRAIIPGAATTNALCGAATRVHNLDRHGELNFIVDGKQLPLGIPISESPLANSRDVEVVVVAATWWKQEVLPPGKRSVVLRRGEGRRYKPPPAPWWDK